MTSNNIDVYAFTVCEDIREEVGGKVSLMGVYPGALINVQGEGAEVGRAIPSLCFYILLSGVTGKCAISVSLSGPNGSIGKEARQDVEIPPKTKFHAIQLKFTPFKLQGLGDYKVLVSLNSWAREFPFKIVSE